MTGMVYDLKRTQIASLLLLVSFSQPLVMFDPTEAVSALCQLSRDELYEIQGIEKLRMLLKNNACESSKFTETVLQRLQELQGFCEARDAPAVVGAKPTLDSRLIDVRFVDGRSRTQGLQANIRRVMGERSLAIDYVAANPERLTNAARDKDIRGKRNSGTIPSYVTQRFPSEVQDIASKAIRNGLKLLVLEDAGLLPTDNQHGLIGLVALAHRQFERLKVQELSKELQTAVLAEALQLVTNLAPLFSKAFDVYTAQTEEPQTPRERMSESPEDREFYRQLISRSTNILLAISVQSSPDVAPIRTQECQTTKKRVHHDTCYIRPSKASRKIKATCTHSGTSAKTRTATSPVHCSRSHYQGRQLTLSR